MGFWTVNLVKISKYFERFHPKTLENRFVELFFVWFFFSKIHYRQRSKTPIFHLQMYAHCTDSKLMRKKKEIRWTILLKMFASIFQAIILKLRIENCVHCVKIEFTNFFFSFNMFCVRSHRHVTPFTLIGNRIRTSMCDEQNVSMKNQINLKGLRVLLRFCRFAAAVAVTVVTVIVWHLLHQATPISFLYRLAIGFSWRCRHHHRHYTQYMSVTANVWVFEQNSFAIVGRENREEKKRIGNFK